MSTLVSLSLFACLLGQAKPESIASDKQDAIAKAVEQLGNKSFSVRETATKFLWQQGRAAEPALKQAAESTDRETRLRATKILAEFDYGIVPTLPMADIALLRNFRDGNVELRESLLIELARSGRFEMLGNVVSRESMPEIRRELLSSLYKQKAIVENILIKHQIEKLAERIGADQPEEWRTTLITDFYFRRDVLTQLVANRQADAILDQFKKQKDPAQLAIMIREVIENPPTLSHFLQTNRVETLLELLRKHADKTQRLPLLSLILLNQDEETFVILEQQQTKAVWQVAGDLLDEKELEILVVSAWRGNEFMKTWLAKTIVEDLIKEVVGNTVGVKRARVLGALVSCDGIVKHYYDAEKPFFWVDLAKDEKDPTARRIFLLNWRRYSSWLWRIHSDEYRRKSVEILWEFVRGDDNEEWQIAFLAAMADDFRVLNGQSSAGITNREPMRGPQDLEWLWQFVKREATDERGAVLEVLTTYDSAFMQWIIEKDRFDQLIKIAKSYNDWKRGRILGRIVSNPLSIKYLKKDNRLDLVISLIKEETSDEGQRAFLQFVFFQQRMGPVLLGANLGEPLIEAIKGINDKAFQASMWRLLSHERVVLKHFVEKKQMHELLGFAKYEPNPETRCLHLLGLGINEFAMSALIEQGELETLLGLIEINSKTSKHLERLFQNISVWKTLIAEKKLETVFQKLLDKSEPASREEFVKGMVSNRLIVLELLKEEQINFVFFMINKFDNAKTRDLLRQEFVKGLVSSNEMVALILKEKRTEFLFSVIADINDAKTRDSFWQILFDQTDAVGKFLEAQKNSEVLFEWIKTQPEGMRRRSFTLQVFRSKTLFGVALKQGAFPELFALAENESDSLAQATLMAHLLAKGLADNDIKKQIRELHLDEKLLTRVREEKDEETRYAIQWEIFGNQDLVTELAMEHFETLLKMAFNSPDVRLRSRLAGRLLAIPETIRCLEIGERFEELWRLGTSPGLDVAHINKVEQRVLIDPIATKALLDQGYFKALYEAAKKANDSKRSLITFLSRPTVIVHIVESPHAGEYLSWIEKEELSAAQRAEVIYPILRNPTWLSLLVEKGGMETLLKQPFTPFPSEQARMKGRILGSPPVLKVFAKQKQLKLVVESLNGFDPPHDEEFLFGLALAFKEAADDGAILMESEILEGLWKVVHDAKHSHAQGAFLELILLDSAATKWLIKRNGIADLLKMEIPKEDKFHAKLLRLILTNRESLAAIDEAKLWNDLANRCLAVEEESQRSRLIAELIASPVSAARMDDANRLVEIFDIIAHERPRGAANAPWLQISSSTPILDLLKKRERIESLKEAAVAVENRPYRAAVLENISRWQTLQGN